MPRVDRTRETLSELLNIDFSILYFINLLEYGVSEGKFRKLLTKKLIESRIHTMKKSVLDEVRDLSRSISHDGFICFDCFSRLDIPVSRSNRKFAREKNRLNRSVTLSHFIVYLRSSLSREFEIILFIYDA